MKAGIMATKEKIEALLEHGHDLEMIQYHTTNYLKASVPS